MLNPLQVALANQLLGRDVSPDIQKFYEARHKLGQALTAEQQVFVSEQWQKVDVFLASEKGRTAAALFVEEWMESMK